MVNRGRVTSSRSSKFRPWTCKKERFLFWTVTTIMIYLITSRGTKNTLLKVLNSWYRYSQLRVKLKMEDSQSSSTKAPDACPCISQAPSLETQPCTSVQHVHSALQAPAACTPTCSWLLASLGSLLGGTYLLPVTHSSKRGCALK